MNKTPFTFNGDQVPQHHSAIFAEVRVDEELDQVRVTRIVSAVAAGRIINPKTARSQILGGVVMGLGHTRLSHVPDPVSAVCQRRPRPPASPVFGCGSPVQFS